MQRGIPKKSTEKFRMLKNVVHMLHIHTCYMDIHAYMCEHIYVHIQSTQNKTGEEKQQRHKIGQTENKWQTQIRRVDSHRSHDMRMKTIR